MLTISFAYLFWIRMGNTCKPMAVSFQCMTKSTTIKKKFKKKEKNKTMLNFIYFNCFLCGPCF